MINFDTEYFNIGYLDTLSYGQTFMHRLNPGIKLVVTMVFIVTVVSFPKYEISGMIPFFIFPVFIITAAGIPAGVIIRKVLVVSPFVLFVGIFNPLLDTRTMYSIFEINVSGGWVSLSSILIKFTLAISSSFLLIATTSFPGICLALGRLRTPKIIVMQLLFLYRYLFVLTEETMRIVRARNMRTFRRKGRELRTFINIAGVLLVRSMERSERIYQAMCSRGFDGRVRLMRDFRARGVDIIFASVAIAFFIALRNYNIPEIIGGLFLP